MDLDLSSVSVKTEEEFEVIDIDTSCEEDEDTQSLKVEEIVIDQSVAILDEETSDEEHFEEDQTCENSLEDANSEEELENERSCEGKSEDKLNQSKLNEPQFCEVYLEDRGLYEVVNNKLPKEDLKTGRASEVSLNSEEKSTEELVPEVNHENGLDTRESCLMLSVSSKSEVLTKSRPSVPSTNKGKKCSNKIIRCLRNKDVPVHTKTRAKSSVFNRFIKKKNMVKTNLGEKWKKNFREKMKLNGNRTTNGRGNKSASGQLKIENVRSIEQVLIKIENNDVASLTDSMDGDEVKPIQQIDSAGSAHVSNGVMACNGVDKTDGVPNEEILDSQYSCQACGFSCSKKRQLENHMVTHNEIEERFECKHCDFRSLYYPNLRSHMKNVHKTRPEFSCPKCDFSGCNPRALKNHMLVHSGKACFQCSYCQYMHNRRSGIAHHIATQHIDMDNQGSDNDGINAFYKDTNSRNKRDSKRNNSRNSRNVRSDSSLSMNDELLNTENGGDKSTAIKAIASLLVKKVSRERKSNKKNDLLDDPTGSEFSDLSAETMSLLSENEHCVAKETSTLSLAHVDVGNNSPLMAGPSTSEMDPLHVILPSDVKMESVTLNGSSSQFSSQSLNSPRKNMQRHKHTCKKCTFSSKTLMDLEVHLSKTHEKKACRCDFCDYSTEHIGCLKRHILLVHIKNRPYKCSMCSFRCGIQSNLFSHMLIHSDQKPYACDQCDYRSRKLQDLKLHQNRHYGIKNFSCEYCPFRCDTKSYLKSHMFQHTGETKYVCNICGYKSARNQCLQKHMKKHS